MSFRSALIALSFAGLTAGAVSAQTAQPTPPRPAQPAQPVRPAQPAPPVARPAQPATAPAAPAAQQVRKVNLNTATAAELDALPQIGEARAKAIIEARTKGKFKNWDDFVARNVVPKNAENAIKDRVSF